MGAYDLVRSLGHSQCAPRHPAFRSLPLHVSHFGRVLGGYISFYFHSHKPETTTRDLAKSETSLTCKSILLTEQENTKMLKLVEPIAEKVGAVTNDDLTLQVLEQATRPEKLVEQIQKATETAGTKP